MAASSPTGSQFWYDGQVWAYIVNGSNDPGAAKFWYDGQVFEGLAPASATTALDWNVQSAAPLSAPSRRHLHQSHAFVGVDFTPPEEITLDKWEPHVFQRLRQPNRLIRNDGATMMPSSPLPPTMPDQWLPQFPDRIWERRRASDFTALFSPPRDDTSASLVSLDWLPTHPSKIDRRVLPAANHPTLFQPDVESLPDFTMEWLPNYVDRVYPRPPLPTQGTMSPIDFPEATQLDKWLPRYPSKIDRLPRSIEYLSFFSIPRDDTAAQLVSLDWLAKYPDRIWQRGRSADFPFLFNPPADDVSAITLDWLANYPDKIDRLTLPRALHPFFMQPPAEDVVAGLMDWIPTFPDRVNKLPPLRIPGGLAPTFFPDVIITPDKWMNYLPQIVWRNRLASSIAWYHPAFAAQLFTGSDFLHAEWSCSPSLAAKFAVMAAIGEVEWQSAVALIGQFAVQPSLQAEFESNLSLGANQGTNP